MTTLNIAKNAAINNNTAIVREAEALAQTFANGPELFRSFARTFNSKMLDHKIDSQMFVLQDEKVSPVMFAVATVAGFLTMAAVIGASFAGRF